MSLFAMVDDLRLRRLAIPALAALLPLGCYGGAEGGDEADAVGEESGEDGSSEDAGTSGSDSAGPDTESEGEDSEDSSSDDGGTGTGTDAGESEGSDTDEPQPCTGPSAAPADSWSSAIVYPDADGYLVYESDAEGNRVPDFSAAGYHRGELELPTLPVVLELGPSGADDTEAIQAAIDTVAAMPLDGDGHRGAILLAPGEYTISGTVNLDASGVVLRGSGRGEDPDEDTILRAVGDTPHQRDVLVVGSGNHDRWTPEIEGTRSDVTTELVAVGDFELEVAEPEHFAVGDHVVLVHPCTDAWLAAIDYGGTEDEDPWAEDSHPLVFVREIMAIDGATLRFDAPVFNALDRGLSQSYVYVADRSELVTEVGVESLRIDVETAGGEDEDHAWNALVLRGVEDAWVEEVAVLHFGLGGVQIETGARITVADVLALDPVAQVTGGRMYNFNASGAQQVLVRDCVARGGRHHYVSNGTSWTSGIVFLRSTSIGANASSEGHRRWSMGLLYDNIVEQEPAEDGKILLGLYSRGNYGTSHGWSAAHSVAWNYDLGAGLGIIQKPPTAQNYAIGGAGSFAGEKPPAPFDQPEGYIEGSDTPGLFPESLYEHQLVERLCPAE
ncbi:peptidoglycan-binding protein [Pseudenhygromyxa sp. WMMC2535]|uniref:peptidoglycan-binding protein n=1 Tax=Pseudenhygromyxa sp. WMMC2535 TaxID=2712867 RepID=UPI001553F288|nr:peptidoglycan-binding protein [Pseudenhygromyxa sp. WMMC2535]NVB41453.1 peptidoglycan-binding protein [Pseudenhygromyxa sp. WMMC2535]